MPPGFGGGTEGAGPRPGFAPRLPLSPDLLGAVGGGFDGAEPLPEDIPKG